MALHWSRIAVLLHRGDDSWFVSYDSYWEVPSYGSHHGCASHRVCLSLGVITWFWHVWSLHGIALESNCSIAPQRRWFMIRLIWFILRGPVSWISSRMCLRTGWNGQGRVACRWSSCVCSLWCLQGLSACVKKFNLDHLHSTFAPLLYCTTEAIIHDSPRDVSVTRGISWRWNVLKPNPTSVVWGGTSWLVSSDLGLYREENLIYCFYEFSWNDGCHLELVVASKIQWFQCDSMPTIGPQVSMTWEASAICNVKAWAHNFLFSRFLTQPLQPVTPKSVQVILFIPHSSLAFRV